MEMGIEEMLSEGIKDADCRFRVGLKDITLHHHSSIGVSDTHVLPRSISITSRTSPLTGPEGKSFLSRSRRFTDLRGFFLCFTGETVAKGMPRFVMMMDSPPCTQRERVAKLFLRSATVAVFMIDNLSQ